MTQSAGLDYTTLSSEIGLKTDRVRPMEELIVDMLVQVFHAIVFLDADTSVVYHCLVSQSVSHQNWMPLIGQ